jgi:hypothetical protein
MFLSWCTELSFKEIFIRLLIMGAVAVVLYLIGKKL